MEKSEILPTLLNRRDRPEKFQKMNNINVPIQLKVGIFFTILIINYHCKNSTNNPDTSQSPKIIVEELLINDEDPQDTEINNTLHAITLAFKNHIEVNNNKQKELLDLFTTEEVLITDSLRTANTFFSEMEQDRSSRQEKTVHPFEKKMFYDNELYYPSLRLYDSKFDSQAKVMFCIGSEVNDADEIICYIDNVPKLVSESLADSIKNPMIIVNVGTNKIVEGTIVNNIKWEGDRPEDSLLKTETSSTYIAEWDSYQIKNGYRYESSGRSDLAYLMHYYLPNSSSTFCWDNEMFGSWHPYTPVEEEVIKRIKKEDIEDSLVFPDDEYLTEQPILLTDLNGNQFYITVHERDWYASRKSVQGCCSAHLTSLHKPRMKYSSNWYYNGYCGFGFQGSWVGASFFVSNSKCSLKIKRTQ